MDNFSNFLIFQIRSLQVLAYMDFGHEYYVRSLSVQSAEQPSVTSWDSVPW